MKNPLQKKQFVPLRYSGTQSNARPFWTRAAGYYFLSFAIALTLFFIVWAILLEAGDVAAFIPAGIVAGLFLISSFVLREVLLRRDRIAQIDAYEMLSKNVKSAKGRREKRIEKLSIKRNKKLVEDINEKSKAARVLSNLPDAHWEAFELCDSYLRMTRSEIARTHINSPRMGPISKTRGRVKKLHKSHLLKWAKVKSSSLMLQSKELGATQTDRIESASLAMITLDTALEFYPREKDLVDSNEAIREYIASIRISHAFNEAKVCENEGDIETAIVVLRKVQESLKKFNLRKRDEELIDLQIRAEIDRLRN